MHKKNSELTSCGYNLQKNTQKLSKFKILFAYLHKRLWKFFAITAVFLTKCETQYPHGV